MSRKEYTAFVRAYADKHGMSYPCAVQAASAEWAKVKERMKAVEKIKKDDEAHRKKKATKYMDDKEYERRRRAEQEAAAIGEMPLEDTVEERMKYLAAMRRRRR